MLTISLNGKISVGPKEWFRRISLPHFTWDDIPRLFTLCTVNKFQQ